ncbi:hypothetical protein Q671_05675 [Halomonas sp. PBN3]|nr:hypothetical protein Q671_05675 [Halomonas sp. PBN3]
MSCLVWTTLFHTETTKQWIPDSLGYVVVIQRLSKTVAKNIFTFVSCDGMLPLESIQYRAKQRNFTLRPICLGIFSLASYECFSDQDFTLLEIDMLPFQAIDFSGP